MVMPLTCDLCEYADDCEVYCDALREYPDLAAMWAALVELLRVLEVERNLHAYVPGGGGTWFPPVSLDAAEARARTALGREAP